MRVITGGARARVDGSRTVVLDRPDALRGSADVGLFADLEPSLFLVDGNNVLWRAAHAPAAPFLSRDGRVLTPVFRFFTLLRRALGTYGLFSECVVCFDGAQGWSHRLAIDGSYKSNRHYESKDVSFMAWLPEIRAALGSAGVACVEHERHEADDVIATIAARGGRRVRIVSTDRDYYQLVGPSVTVVNAKSRPALVDGGVVERHGVTPDQWCDFRALAGDASDGIPGVRGVGPKAAARLLSGGLTLEDLEETGRLETSVGRRVRERWQDVARWRELIRLRTDVPISYEATRKPTPALPSPNAVCRELGLLD